MLSTEHLRMVFAEEDKFENFKKLTSNLVRNEQIFEYDEKENAVPVSRSKANKAVRQVFMDVCGLTEEDLKSRKKRRRAEAIHKYEIFEIVEEELEFKIEEGFHATEWFNQFVEEHNLAEDDDVVFSINDRQGFVVEAYSGDNHDIAMQQLGGRKHITVKTSPRTVKIGKDIDLIILGKIDFSDWIDKVAAAYVQDHQSLCYVALKRAADSLTAPFVGTGALVKKDFDKLVQKVKDINGCDVIIMGTDAALGELTALVDVNWASDEKKKEVSELGRLGFYRTNRLVEIPQRIKINDLNTELIDSNKLYIIPVTEDKFIKFVTRGEAEITETTEKGATQDDFETYEVSEDVGADVVLGQYFGCWTLAA